MSTTRNSNPAFVEAEPRSNEENPVASVVVRRVERISIAGRFAVATEDPAPGVAARATADAPADSEPTASTYVVTPPSTKSTLRNAHASPFSAEDVDRGAGARRRPGLLSRPVARSSTASRDENARTPSGGASASETGDGDEAATREAAGGSGGGNGRACGSPATGDAGLTNREPHCGQDRMRSRARSSISISR